MSTLETTQELLDVGHTLAVGVDGLIRQCLDVVGMAPTGGEPLSVYSCIPLALFITVVRLIFHFSFMAIGKRVGVAHKDLPKLGESLFKAIYYGIGWLICIYVASDLGIWPNVSNCWKDFHTQTTTPTQQSYYMWELGYYVSGILAMGWLETKKTDNLLLSAHHLVTIGLIGSSFVGGYSRIGLVVLMFHDLADVFLEFAKFAKYLSFDMVSNISFLMLIVTWAYHRLVLFPMHVVHSIYFDSVPYTSYWGHKWFCALISILQVMHVYWFYLILGVARSAIAAGDLNDTREVDDDDKKRN